MIYNAADVGDALRALEMQFGADLGPLVANNDLAATALELAARRPAPPPASWFRSSREQVMYITGLWSRDDFEHEELDQPVAGAGTVAMDPDHEGPCVICARGLGGGDSPEDPYLDAMVTLCACGCHGPVMNPPACDDNNACTTSVLEVIGCSVRCIHKRKVCPCNACAVDCWCVPATGQCQTQPLDCDDDEECTIDRCYTANSDGCRYSPLPGGHPCSSDGDPCTLDVCVRNEDETSATCQTVPACTENCATQCCPTSEDSATCCEGQCQGSACCHGNVCDGQCCQGSLTSCIQYPMCVAGQCVLGSPCDDGDPCTIDQCRSTGCGIACDPPQQAADGTGCDTDDDPCTEDICMSGVCEHPPLCTLTRPMQSQFPAGFTPQPAVCCDGICCETEDPCLVPNCTPEETCEFPEMFCDDEDECTVDYCADGECVFDPISGTPCSEQDADPCTVGECDDGSCQPVPGNNGASCEDDDGNDCSVGECQSGICVPQDLCDSGDFCCAAGTATVCCNETCHGCLLHGELTGGEVTVESPVCVGSELVFIADGVEDSGGTKRVLCTAKQGIDAVASSYTWTVTKPDATQETGAGPAAIVIADLPGEYTCVFKANANRECAPAERTLPEKKGVAVRIRPLSVTFSGTSMYEVQQDDGAGSYPQPHWKDNTIPPDDDNLDPDDHNIPVAYIRGSTVRLTAQFEIEPANAFANATSLAVAGVATAGGNPLFNFKAAVPPSGTITISNVSASGPLPDTVAYLNPLTIVWAIIPFDGEPPDCDIAPTTHRLYLTWGPPTSNARFETLFHIGCTNATGQTDSDDVRNAIWSEFTDRDVRRKPLDGFNDQDNQQMTYYGNWNTSNASTASLLANGDGQCGSWSPLFLDALRAQGIVSINNYVTIYSSDEMTNPGSVGFAVNTWTFAPGNGVSGHPEYPYLNIPPLTGDPIGNGSYNWQFADANEAAGTPGQGTANPASLFRNHQIVEIDGTLYDPSYGVTYNNTNAMDNTAIAAYYWIRQNFPVNELHVGIDLNADSQVTNTVVAVPEVWLFKKNPAANQLVSTTTTYP